MDRTYIPSTIKTKANPEKWYCIDAKGKTLGRLSTQVANILRGKNKKIYTPFLDTGDYVIIINSNEIEVTGKKELQKEYLSHSGYLGGLKRETFQKLKIRKSSRIIEKSVKGMLPKGPLGRKLFTKLKVYESNHHPHSAQKPEII